MFLFQPAVTYRVRDDFSVPNIPVGQNQPPGAISTEPEATNSVRNSDTIDLVAKYIRSSGLSTNTGLNRLVRYEIIETDRESRDLVVECLNEKKRFC